ncbi:alpha/beta hydrolase family protein [Pseudomonas oligotrophica]|uniref:alpha/beta hydrolase family protein n=1 Tax=Pseudomonas oligotrophica TaxID=2912055 RepID=UPI001F195CB4|nr:alpha/beta fold hydrolase [Pseudomonas oligotrophica]MCF7203233.1 alpha/beta fold hydrolase [Pseudomonas oligotrophica]
MPESVSLPCRDGFSLAAQLWRPAGAERGAVIVSSATGVLSRYYARYAGFLAEHGFAVLTYDFRGIGGSRPPRLRELRMRWRDWGDYDFDAAVRFMRQRDPHGLLVAVGHSAGGFMPGFAEAASQVDRYLNVAGQYAYWRDYAADRRLRMFAKWHLLMPALTRLLGYFPGRRLGWLEDLPAGVALEWAGRGARLEHSYPANEHDELFRRFAAIRAPILAVSTSDDEFATPAAMRRGLAYFCNSPRQRVQLEPGALGFERIGHFGLFHDRHRQGFWRASLEWIAEGRNPWLADEVIEAGAPPVRDDGIPFAAAPGYKPGP